MQKCDCFTPMKYQTPYYTDSEQLIHWYTYYTGLFDKQHKLVHFYPIFPQ